MGEFFLVRKKATTPGVSPYFPIMDRLPSFALDEILSYLDPKLVNETFPLVSQGCYTHLRRDDGYVRYFASIVNLPREVPVAYQQYREALLCLYSRQRTVSDIPITGFSTTGGMDSDFMQYWVGNLFDKDLPPYCTKENMENVVCAGVLSIYTETHVDEELQAARKEAAKLLRKNRHIRGMVPVIKPSDSEDPMTPFEEGVFINLVGSRPAYFADRSIPPEERPAFLEHLRSIRNKLANAQTDCIHGLVKDPTQPNLLESKIVRKEVAEQMETYFCVSAVTVSRKGQFTCPLLSFVVFVSYSYVPVEHEEFRKYDNLNEEQDVARLSELGLPENRPGNAPPHCQVREFRRTKDNLQPIIWGKFADKEAEVMEVPLNYVFSGKYLYIKLIRAEDRMREMGDTHDSMNIDVEYLGCRGAVVTPLV